MSDQDHQVKLVPALARGVQILDVIGRHPSGMSAKDIADELGLAKSTIHGLCSTLVSLNLLVRRADQSYQMGPHVMRWANAFTARSDIASEFATIWDDGTDLPGATITLSVLENTDIIYIAARNSEATEGRFDFRSGMRLPASITATGKAMMSHMNEFDVRQLYANVADAESIDALIKQLQSDKACGYSFDNEDVSEGLVCYGAPVLDSKNKPIAGIAVSMLKEDATPEKGKQIVANLTDIAIKLSIRMGADV
ncbi:IclR family transcriptional regulator [Lentilitoribacter sp. EG35]|uniref:IclR family transcriptional regulator n=1 Tax=Lentilitoribacter sp. EG35 TaxID=3234192 RepID=UPI0034601960